MGIKSYIAKHYAAFLVNKFKKAVLHPSDAQKSVFDDLISSARDTRFGKDHHFNLISDYDSFKKHVPLREYEDFKIYIDAMMNEEENVLWPGFPIYICKTSGTTSGAKYIPISKESISNHINSAKLALLYYIHSTGKSDFVSGKMIFLQGSPLLDITGKIKLGRLSGIVANHVPAYLQKNRLPSLKANCIEDWETKVDKIVEETKSEDLRLISGIPSWVQMYFERLIMSSGKPDIKSIFPNFSLFVYGGVNFEPYRPVFQKLIGNSIPSVETYPASEGFIAFQDEQNSEGLLLVVNDGIFYEFIPTSEYDTVNPTRINLAQVELGVNYAIVLNTNAGLWGYVIGDTVKFVSKKPYRIVVSGRIKHFTSAFGEHVIGEEVEKALKIGMQKQGGSIKEFHVSPQIKPSEGLPYHEWFIEFEEKPKDTIQFASEIDQALQEQNVYYKDLIAGKVLRPLVINELNKEAFMNAMKSKGKLGGQNKIPRLANDRQLAQELEKYKK